MPGGSVCPSRCEAIINPYSTSVGVSEWGERKCLVRISFLKKEITASSFYSLCHKSHWIDSNTRVTCSRARPCLCACAAAYLPQWRWTSVRLIHVCWRHDIRTPHHHPPWCRESKASDHDFSACQWSFPDLRPSFSIPSWEWVCGDQDNDDKIKRELQTDRCECVTQLITEVMEEMSGRGAEIRL